MRYIFFLRRPGSPSLAILANFFALGFLLVAASMSVPNGAPTMADPPLPPSLEDMASVFGVVFVELANLATFATLLAKSSQRVTKADLALAPVDQVVTLATTGSIYVEARAAQPAHVPVSLQNPTRAAILHDQDFQDSRVNPSSLANVADSLPLGEPHAGTRCHLGSDHTGIVRTPYMNNSLSLSLCKILCPHLPCRAWRIR